MTEEAEEARKLFAQKCDFVLAASAPEHFPATQGEKALNEVALIGRSNVGKSSLINALTGRKKLARASCAPGRTQQIIFFNLADRLMLVDLPGYGHAKAPAADVKQWNALVRYYLQKRQNLRLVCLLLDGRHGALAHDLEMMQFLDRAAVNYQIVLTKGDQIPAAERAPRLAQVEDLAAKHPSARNGVLMTSAEKGEGIPELRSLLASFAEN